MKSGKKVNLLVFLVMLTVIMAAFNMKTPVQNGKLQSEGKVVVTLNKTPFDSKAGISKKENGILSVSLESKEDSISKVVFYLVRNQNPIVYRTFTQPSEYSAINLSTALTNEYGVAAGDRVLIEVIGKQSYMINIPVHD